MMRRPSTALLLLAWFVVSGLALVAIEAYAVVTSQPTISALLQGLNDAAPIFGLSVAVLAGILLCHFFGGRRA